jgi:hypothetical protein
VRWSIAFLVLAACPAPTLEEHSPTQLGTTPEAVVPETPVAPPAPKCLASPRLIEVGDTISGLAVGDLSGDGAPDLVLLQDHARGKKYVTVLTVYLGDGAGGFRAAGSTDVGNLVIAAQLGDVDADGHLDVVLAQYREKKIAILRGDGRGGLTAGKSVSTGR